jgi:hypothetical protein
MLTAEFYVAQSAEISAAGFAGNHGLVVRMIEAACLLIEKDSLRLSAFKRIAGYDREGGHAKLCLA